MKKGDIAHLPSGVQLRQLSDGIPSKYCNVEKPTAVIVIETNGSKSKVLFRGDSWMVEEKYLYPIMEG